METEKLKHETECNLLKQERIEYENAYNKVLNELNEYKIRNEELGDVKETYQIIAHSSSIITNSIDELSKDYDDLYKLHSNMELKYKGILTELSELKALNNELKSVNDSYVKINKRLNQRYTKTENELTKLRNILTDIENEINQNNNLENNSETSPNNNTEMKLSCTNSNNSIRNTSLNNIFRYQKSLLTLSPNMRTKRQICSPNKYTPSFKHDTNDLHAQIIDTDDETGVFGYYDVCYILYILCIYRYNISKCTRVI